MITYINVNIGDQLGGNVNTALTHCVIRKISITVPAPADGMCIGSGW